MKDIFLIFFIFPEKQQQKTTSVVNCLLIDAVVAWLQTKAEETFCY